MKSHLRVLSFAVLLIALISGLHAQQPGAPAGASKRDLRRSAPAQRFIAATKTLLDTTYRTTVFTFGDIAVFSYFDGTDVSVLSGSTEIQSWHLNADTIGTYSTSSGVYRIVGNKPFTVLIGDAITNYVNGYFAMDASGLGVSTKFNTWMMNSASGYDPHFIVFGYQNGTQFTIKNLSTKAIIAAGALNAGQYYDFPNVSSISNTPLQVTSNLPVSVLSYTDQDYYVPSSNGTFTGTLFYGFSGYSGGWANSITTVSYANNNQVTVKNLTTGAVMKTYTLNVGQVYCDTITSDVFWSVSSTGTLAVANIPYGTWSGSYYYMARSTDQTGRNVGTLFYVPTISSRLDVFSFEDNNSVRITQLGLFTDYPYASPVVADSGTLNAGDVRTISSTSYGSYVYKVEATKNVSVLQSNGGAGADFMPLNFALQLPDLAISSDDITFNPGDSTYVAGDKINVTVNVTNQGALTATSVLVYAYEGDPDAGGIAPLIASGNINSIPPGGNSTISFDYIIPSKPEYKQIVVKVDPLTTILESNESNNKASRPLKPNLDVQPPIAVNITAPNGLLIDSVSHALTPNPFKVQADLFNTGNVTAINVRVVLTLNNGLTLASGPQDTTLGNIPANGSAKIIWWINASKDSTGLNLYSFKITADNATAKDVRRAINIPDIAPPSAPTGLTLTGQIGGAFLLSWNTNPEKDLAGYRVYYSVDDSSGWNGTGADGGNSPIIVPKVNSTVITGLLFHVRYRFALKAFDYSNNLSPFSNTVTGTPDTIGALPIPKIMSIWDVPGDNGKLVFVKWKVPKPAASSGIKNFAIWYWNRDSLLWVHVNGGIKSLDGDIESLDDTIYSATAPTVFDSTKSRGMYWSVFRVSAHGLLPTQYVISPSDSGYSLDNIFPSVPTGLSGTTNGQNLIVLRWYPVPDNDLQYYKVYRDVVSGFTVNDSKLIKVVADTAFNDNGVTKGTSYYYRIVAVDYSGNESSPSPEFTLKVTSVKDQSSLPTDYALEQNYPNPFNPSTTIRFALPARSIVALEIINTLGQTVATLVNTEKDAGYHEAVWNATASSGTYFFRIRATSVNDPNNTFFNVKKMVLMK